MANSQGGRIIIDGNIKHRHSAIGFQKWKLRYVAFQLTNAGRLEFVVYKEPPAVPDNEIKHVAIDEYGGLETNLRLDNERFTFAIITNSATECFSVDSLQELTDWTKAIQEYLGKELVLNISIPFKQNILRAGRAQLRIRNLGFTITTCDHPPKAQGSWQIIHIRKYGGSEAFKFETGSRCPTGECLYVLHTEDNKRVKTLFSELSQHKPIFKDDRVGRRMTLEKSMGVPVHRMSLPQPPEEPPTRLYENTQDSPIRRYSAAVTEDSRHRGTPGTAVSIEDLAGRGDRQYANWSSAQRSTSPTKKPHNQVPLQFYSVAPPSVIRNNNQTPSSSPEDDKYLSRDEFLSRGEEDYSQVAPGRKHTLIGEHLVFAEEVDQVDMYQNLKFLNGGNSHTNDNIERKLKAMDSLPEIQPTVSEAEQGSYTNVQLALESFRNKKAESIKERKHPVTTVQSKREQQRHGRPVTTAAGMRGSHSSSELNSPQSCDKAAPDYYNMCVPELPANSTSSAGHRLPQTLSLTSLHRNFGSSEGVDGHASNKSLSDIERRSKSPLVTNYDTLAPVPEARRHSEQPQYDRLSAVSRNSRSDSSSPELLPSPYQRKVNILQHHHKYEYIDVALEHSGESNSSDGVFSPTHVMENPLSWVSSDNSLTRSSEAEESKRPTDSAHRMSLSDVPNRHSSEETSSSLEMIPESHDRGKGEVPAPTVGGKIANIQVQLVRSGSKDSPPLPPRRKTSEEDTPPVPPRSQHRYPLPPVQIDIENKPPPPKPVILRMPQDLPSEKYVSLTFRQEEGEFDDHSYSAVHINPPVSVTQAPPPPVRRGISHDGDNVEYSSVNFPVTNALNTTRQQRMSEKAKC